MADLRRGRDLANFVRVGEDREDPNAVHTYTGRSHHKDAMLRHGLLISKEVTPLLDQRICEVCVALDVAREVVSAFVYNSSDVQADCFIEGPQSCVLRFTSGLINLLSEDEFQFVAGHELGHFLLNHEACAPTGEANSLEGYMVSRARELSADRLGFLAAGSIEASIRAIIKTASGLGEGFIRFDVSKFIAQGDLLAEPSRGEARESSHPSLLIRSRALLWFSMAVQCKSELSHDKLPDLKRVDGRVLRDLERLVDGQTRQRKSDLIDDITLWKVAILTYYEGAFEKGVQDRLAESLGQDTLEGLKSFFELFPKAALLGEIEQKLEEAQRRAIEEFPKSSKEIEDEAYNRAYSILQGSDP